MVVEASVDADLRTVRGTVHTEGLDDATWLDALSRLPGAPNDLQLFRTFPGRPSTGEVHWTVTDDGLVFETRLPRRYGAIGATSHGLMANGGWYPQPVTESSALPLVEWEVTVHLP
ncbi:MAG: hypothetical protein ACI9K2_004730, partial [Myxococcota bacterium]